MTGNMKNKLILLAGIIVLIASLSVRFYLQQQTQLATSRDQKKNGFGMISSEFLPCKWETIAPERIMKENTSQSIVVKVTGLDGEQCESLISLRAPGFETRPNKEEQTIKLPPNTNGSLAWIITPHKSGTYEISSSDMIDTRIFGITVTNVLGLNATQAQIVSILGTIFGPMMTVPWWFDRLRERRKKQNTQEPA
jgi:hypothetical protein